MSAGSDVGQAVDRALRAAMHRERARLARILADHGHVALAVCVETFDDAGEMVDLCYCPRLVSGERDPRCEVCRGTGERQPTIGGAR